jgi:hypothetical protein
MAEFMLTHMTVCHWLLEAVDTQLRLGKRRAAQVEFLQAENACNVATKLLQQMEAGIVREELEIKVSETQDRLNNLRITLWKNGKSALAVGIDRHPTFRANRPAMAGQLA